MSHHQQPNDSHHPLLNGHGTYVDEHGTTFEGHFQNGLLNGVGYARWSSSSSSSSDGGDNDNTTEVNVGPSYYGDFVNGQPTGNGTYIWPATGDLFQGQFLDGQRHGTGTCWYGNGDKYEGEWMNNKYHGKGIMHISSKQLFYDCLWENGELKEGILIDALQGTVYEGQFLNRKPNGIGFYTTVTTTTTPPQAKTLMLNFINGEIDKNNTVSAVSDHSMNLCSLIPSSFFNGIPTEVVILSNFTRKIQPILPPPLFNIKAEEPSVPIEISTVDTPSHERNTHQGKFIFTIHLPYGGKKSVILINLSITIKSILEPVFKLRNLDVTEFIATSLDGKTLDMNAKIKTLETREIIVTGINDVFTVYLPYGGKKKILLNPTQTLRTLLEKICNVRNMKLEEYVPLAIDGKPLDLNLMLAFVENHCAWLAKIGEKINIFLEPEEIPIPTPSTPPPTPTPTPTTPTPTPTPTPPPHKPFKIPDNLLDLVRNDEFKPYPFPVFGVPLEKLYDPNDNNTNGTRQHSVPYVIRVMLKYLLNEEGITNTGIFRIPGCVEVIQHFKTQIDEGKEIVFKEVSYYDVAGLLKEFIRKLPEPLIPRFYDQNIKMIIDEHKKESTSESVLMQSMKEVIDQLPRENLELFQTLIKFLCFVISYSHTNKMDVDNIIKCIVPTVGCVPAIFYYPLTHLDFFFGDKALKDSSFVEVDRRVWRPRVNRVLVVGSTTTTPPPPPPHTNNTQQQQHDDNDGQILF